MFINCLTLLAFLGFSASSHAQTSVGQCHASFGNLDEATDSAMTYAVSCRSFAFSPGAFDATLADSTASQFAIAIASSSPVLGASEYWGVAINLGTFNGQNAVGAAALAVVAQDADGIRRITVYAGGGSGLNVDEYSGKLGIKIHW